jgi:hypothetical protein
MLLARHSLPDIPALRAAEKWKPAAVALPLGDSVLGVFGALKTPMTVVRWSPGAEPLVREYPYVDFLEVFDEIQRREKDGDFDAFSDATSRLLADRPLQLVAVDGQPWLVRGCGHARIDAETLDVVPVARSRVKRLVPLNGDVLAASGTQYSGIDAFQRIQRCPARLLDEPIFRTRTGLTNNSDWVVQGTSFPAGDAATAFTAGVAKVRGAGAGDFHGLGATVLGREVIVYGCEIHRSGTSRPALVAVDIEKAEVTRYARLKDEEPLIPIVTEGTLFGIGAKSIVRIAPDSFTVIDRADLPAGVRLFGHDASRIVALHKRSKSVLVLASASFSRPLAAAVEEMSAALARPPKAAARSKGATAVAGGTGQPGK